MRFYSDITQAISHVLKMRLETGRWVEPVSTSVAGGTARLMPRSGDSPLLLWGQDPRPGLTRNTLCKTASPAFAQQGFPGALLHKT